MIVGTGPTWARSRAAFSVGAGVTVPKGVCVRLGDRGELSVCFNPQTLCYEAVWSGGFVKFSATRHGFMDGLILDGTPMPRPEGHKPDKPFVYHGFYRHGKRVVFAYRIGDQELLDAPWVENGRFTRVVAPADQASSDCLHTRRTGPVAPGDPNRREARAFGKLALRGGHDRTPAPQPVERPPFLRRP